LICVKTASENEQAPLQYNLTVSLMGDDKCLDLVVRGPLHRPSDELANARSTPALPDFPRACAAIQQSSEHPIDFKAGIVSGANELYRFNMKQHTKIHKSPCRPLWLRGVFSDLQRQSKEFSRKLKIGLAFKIVESGLYLLGTSWLSYLDSNHILKGDCGRYLLGTSQSTAFNELDQIEPQTFHIGTLLTEIALCRPIDGIDKREGPLGDEWNLVMTLPTYGQRSIPAPEIVLLLKGQGGIPGYTVGEMGEKYAEAVNFCLQQSGELRQDVWQKDWRVDDWPDRRRKYEEALFCDYYTQVYLP
jgi:hypothetical protein